MIRLAATLSVFTLLAPTPPTTPPSSTATQEQARFTLGVLRRDGAVLPFAAFDGKRWSAPWPATASALDIPIALDDVPERWWGKPGPATEMVAWSDGASLGRLRLERPVRLPIMCEARIAVRSSYKSKQPPPPPFEQPFPKDGVVISGGHPIERLSSVPKDSAEWTNTQRAIGAEFDKAEDRAAGAFTAWRHPVPRGARPRFPIEVEAIYRAPMDEPEWDAYYVEAIREYPPGPEDEGCGLVTFVAGWIRIGPKNKVLFDLDGQIAYCDRKGGSYMLPLGLIRVAEKTYWIYQISGFDREWYVVARPTPRNIELHVEYPAGYCPR